MEYLGLGHAVNYLTPNNRLNLSYSSSNIPDMLAVSHRSNIGLNMSRNALDSLTDSSQENILQRSHTMVPWHSPTYYAHAMPPTHDSGMALATGPLSNISSLALRQVESLKVPEIYSAARNALNTRYTPASWLDANRLKLNNSEKARNISETLRKDCARLGKFMDDRVRRAQEESSKRLGERISDISFLKQELVNEHGRLVQEMSVLMETKRCVEKALAETDNPLYITQECLFNREKRQGIDLVHDAPESALLSEMDTIRRCQQELRFAIDKAQAHMKKTQHMLEVDSQDKFIALQIDEVAHHMKDSSQGVAFHQDIEAIDNNRSIPDTWAEFTAKNLKRSQADRETSKEIRNFCEKTIIQSVQLLRDAWERSSNELSRRAQETSDARTGLETSLNKVLQEIHDMENNISFLRKCIGDKEAPLKVAQSRLDTRLRRPNIEACRDPAYNRLVREVQELKDSINQLMNKLHSAENLHQQLLMNRNCLEQDLSVKSNSLHIDREQCLGMRRTFPMGPTVYVS